MAPERLKVVVVGDAGCGKSLLLYAYDQRSNPETSKAFDVKQWRGAIRESFDTTVNVGKRRVKINLFDGGDGDHKSTIIREMIYPDTDVVLLCYDCSNKMSFKNVRKFWLHEVNRLLPNVPKILVGCKADLNQISKGVSKRDAEKMCHSVKAKDNLECSALNELKGIDKSDSVRKIFKTAIKHGLETRDRGGEISVDANGCSCLCF